MKTTTYLLGWVFLAVAVHASAVRQPEETGDDLQAYSESMSDSVAGNARGFASSTSSGMIIGLAPIQTSVVGQSPSLSMDDVASYGGVTPVRSRNNQAFDQQEAKHIEQPDLPTNFQSHWVQTGSPSKEQMTRELEAVLLAESREQERTEQLNSSPIITRSPAPPLGANAPQSGSDNPQSSDDAIRSSAAAMSPEQRMLANGDLSSNSGSVSVSEVSSQSANVESTSAPASPSLSEGEPQAQSVSSAVEQSNDAPQSSGGEVPQSSEAPQVSEAPQSAAPVQQASVSVDAQPQSNVTPLRSVPKPFQFTQVLQPQPQAQAQAAPVYAPSMLSMSPFMMAPYAAPALSSSPDFVVPQGFDDDQHALLGLI